MQAFKFKQMKPSQVSVETGAYERAYGKRPSGTGAWAFCKVDPRRDDYLSHCLWFSNQSYTQAKKAAKAEAAALGVEVLYVCS